MIPVVHRITFDFGAGVTRRHPEENTAVVEDSVRAHLPEQWRLLTWTLDGAVEFIQTHYPFMASAFAALGGIDFPIAKCDFFRYLLMYHFGGIYMDMDFVPTRPMNALLEDMLVHQRVFYSPAGVGTPRVILTEEWPESRTLSKSLHNGFLISTEPFHPFWMSLITGILTNPLPIASQTDVYRVTGPQYLCAHAKTHASSFADIVVLPYYYCCPFLAQNDETHKTVICNGPIDVPPLETNSWTFFSTKHVPYIKNMCPVSYFACIYIGGSMWKKE